MGTKKRQMLIKRGDTTFDKILAHYINPDLMPLSETNQEILNRLNEVFALRLNHFSSQQIVNKWVEEKGICKAQAYLDIRNSEKLFGNVLKSDAEGARAIWLEHTRDLLKRCIQKGDRNNETKVLKMLAEYGGFAGEDNLEFNPEKLENREIKIVLPKLTQDLINKFLENGVVDFNGLDVTQIDYEDVE
jgi:ABC-type phosphate transport system auxiliary subunit